MMMAGVRTRGTSRALATSHLARRSASGGRYFRAAALGLAALLPLLQGCSYLFGQEGYFRDRQHDYRQATSIDEISIPPGLDSSSIDELYVIPPGAEDAVIGEVFEVPRPVPLQADKMRETVLLQKLGDEQWVLVNVAPGQLWPQIRHYLLANRIGLAKEDGAHGLVETDWLVRPDSDRRERYRFRVEQGVQRNTSEIHILQMQRPASEIYSPQDWPDNSDDGGREDWMSRELASFLASSLSVGSVSLVAQGISTVSKLDVAVDDKGFGYIILHLPFARGWASVARALGKAQFEINDMNREQGEFYVTYQPRKVDNNQAPGFWARLFGSDDNDLADLDYAGESYTIKVDAMDDQRVKISFSQPQSLPGGEKLNIGDGFSPEETERLIRLIKGYLN